MTIRIDWNDETRARAAALLKQHAKRTKTSYAELGKRIERTRGSVDNVMNARAMRMSSYERVAGALSMSLEEVLGLSPAPVEGARAPRARGLDEEQRARAASRLRDELARRSLTQVQFAKLAGRSRISAQNVLAGKPSRRSVWEHYADALSMSLEDLLSDDPVVPDTTVVQAPVATRKPGRASSRGLERSVFLELVAHASRVGMSPEAFVLDAISKPLSSPGQDERVVEEETATLAGVLAERIGALVSKRLDEHVSPPDVSTPVPAATFRHGSRAHVIREDGRVYALGSGGWEQVEAFGFSGV